MKRRYGSPIMGINMQVCNRKGNANLRYAFTLVEVLIALSILAAILIFTSSIINQTLLVWRTSINKIETFQSARSGFDQITKNLSQATLNTYYDYDNPVKPTRYIRKSELAFVIGSSGTNKLPGEIDTGQSIFFSAPLGYTLNATSYGGMESLLNTCGYYIEFDKNRSIPSHIDELANPYRYRLMQLLVPTEKKNIYDKSMESSNSWFSNYTNVDAQPIAENIIALVIMPLDPASSSPIVFDEYDLDTRSGAELNPQPATAHQLPPAIKITMIAIDEESAKQLENKSLKPKKISNILAGKFSDPSSYEDDLQKVEAELNESGISYKIFNSSVLLRESKWTK